MRIRTLALVVGSAAAGAAAAYAFALRPWWRDWGVDPTLAEATFPGDDMVEEPTAVDTRVIEINAPPSAVWPWLVQMGYGRGGWYSYDSMDMRGRSAAAIMPEWQTLAEGDLVPTAPGSGLVVRHVESGRSLVLFIDNEIVQDQAGKAAAARAADEGAEQTPANLRAVGAMMPTTPDFAVSWTFVLEPLDDGTRTRLVERLRARMSGGPRGMEVFMSVFGLGIFVMMRKQMLGIRDRVERAEQAGPDEAVPAGEAPGAAAPSEAAPAWPAGESAPA